MADDTRQAQSTPSDESPQQGDRPRRRPKHDFPQTQAGKMWEAFGNPKDPVNTLPGGTFNSAGGKPAEPRWWDALRFDQFNKEGRPSWYQTGCARDSLMVGIGAGGLASMLATTNWAVGGFCVTSSLMYYWCEQRRLEEAKGMAAAVAGMKMLNEKRAKEKAAAAEAAIKAEEVQKKSKWW